MTEPREGVEALSQVAEQRDYLQASVLRLMAECDQLREENERLKRLVVRLETRLVELGR